MGILHSHTHWHGDARYDNHVGTDGVEFGGDHDDKAEGHSHKDLTLPRHIPQGGFEHSHSHVHPEVDAVVDDDTGMVKFLQHRDEPAPEPEVGANAPVVTPNPDAAVGTPPNPGTPTENAAVVRSTAPPPATTPATEPAP